MLFSRQKDVPAEISKVKLNEWYSGLSDTDRVKIGRYLKDADTSSALNFALSVMGKANGEENYALSVLVGDMILKRDLEDIERFDAMEAVIPAYFGAGKYDLCLRCCEEGLSLLQRNMDSIKKRDGGNLPESIMCRNYTVNVLIGAYDDYEGADAALDRFCGMGLISEEDVRYRKQSHKIHKLQRTFDGIFSATKVKDQ